MRNLEGKQHARSRTRPDGGRPDRRGLAAPVGLHGRDLGEHAVHRGGDRRRDRPGLPDRARRLHRQEGPGLGRQGLLSRWGARAALALGLSTLIIALPLATERAEAFGVACPGSSLCNPANLPIIAELGAAAVPAATAAVGGATASTIAVATGGIAGLGTFNAAIGIVGAATAVGVGAIIANGLITSNGIPDGVSLKTQRQTSSGDPDAQCQTIGGVDACISYLAAGLEDHGFSNGYYCVRLNPVAVSNLATMDFLGTLDATPHVGGGWFGIFGMSHTTVLTGLGMSLPAGCTESDYFTETGTATVAPPAPTALWLGTHGSMTLAANPTHGIGTGVVSRFTGSIRSTVTCKGGSIDGPISISQHVDVESGDDLPVPPVTCPPGSIPSDAHVDFKVDGTTDWIPLTAGDIPSDVKNLVDLYPDCFGPGVAPCKFELQTLRSGEWTSCGEAAVDCPSWVAQAQVSPSQYRCVYGTYTIDFDKCSAFRSTGQVLPNTRADRTTVPTTAAPDEVSVPPVVKAADPATAIDTPPDTSANEQPIECQLGGGGGFWTNITGFFGSLPSWIACMFVPKGWDRGGLIVAAFSAGAVGALITAYTLSMPGGLACGAVANVPWHDEHIELNTCNFDVAPGWVKTVVAWIFVLGIGAIVVRRIAWVIGSK